MAEICPHHDNAHPTHSYESCADEHPINAAVAGGCPRCNAIWFARYMKTLEQLAEVQDAVGIFRAAFVVAVGEKSPFAKQALATIDRAMANLPEGQPK